jgi:hypothetical protein
LDYIKKALDLGSNKYASTLLYFDALFESGYYPQAEKTLKTTQSTNQYGYFLGHQNIGIGKPILIVQSTTCLKQLN